MIGLLVQYVDECGDKQIALFPGEKEVANKNIDRLFSPPYKGEFISSVTATEDMKYSQVIMDNWTTPYYGSDVKAHKDDVCFKVF